MAVTFQNTITCYCNKIIFCFRVCCGKKSLDFGCEPSFSEDFNVFINFHIPFINRHAMFDKQQKVLSFAQKQIMRYLVKKLSKISETTL